MLLIRPLRRLLNLMKFTQIFTRDHFSYEYVLSRRIRESSFSLPSAMHFHLRNSHAFTYIIGPHNFPNLFDKILIGRPRFRLEFPEPSRNTHRWKRNVALLTEVNARRMKVGPKCQKLMECLLPRTLLLFLENLARWNDVSVVVNDF